LEFNSINPPSNSSKPLRVGGVAGGTTSSVTCMAFDQFRIGNDAE
jgi:hypothetical protein